MINKNEDITGDTTDILTGRAKVKRKFLTTISEVLKVDLSLIEGEMQRISSISSRYTKPDPRMEMLEQYREITRQAIKEINIRLEINRIVVPQIKEGETLVHGRITDENGYGKKNLVVSLVAEGQKLNIVGKSDASGYFSIILPSTIVNRIKQYDTQVYVCYGTVLIHKVEDPIKISDQKKVKFEVILGEDEIKMMYAQEKPKKDTHKIKKINK